MRSQLSNICCRLTLAEIQNVTVISKLEDIDWYMRLSASGVGFGIHSQHAVQSLPYRLGQTHVIAEQAMGNDDFTLSLGDNPSRVQRFAVRLQAAYSGGSAPFVFAYQAQDGSTIAERQDWHD